MMRRIALIFLYGLIFVVIPVGAQETIELRPYEGDGFQTVVPAEWQEVDTGVFLGSPAGDLILVVQFTPGTDRSQTLTSLLPQLALDAAPDIDETLSAGGLSWDIYNLEVDVVSAGVDIALADTDDGTYLILLQTPIADRDTYYEPVFLPAVNEFSQSEDDGNTPETITLEGFYSVPIPTNWAVDDTNDAYVRLYSPDDLIEQYIIVNDVPVNDAEQAEAAVNAAWDLTMPDLERAELGNITEPPTDAGIDAEYEFAYDIPGGSDVFYGASLIVADGLNYIRLIVGDSDEAGRRSAQIGITYSGFEIASLEITDLSGVDPLPLDDALIAEWETSIERIMMEFEIPGMAIAVVQNGEIILQTGYGVRELGTDLPMTPDTMFAIASTTKTMTTATMAALVDQGLMDWETPVTDVWGDFSLANPDVTEQLTLRNLVCACVGVERRDLELFFNLDDTPQEFIGALAGFELFTDFGEAFQYSNQMIAAGGYLSAVAAGGNVETMREDYIMQVETNIWQPLNMDNTTFTLDTAAAYDDLAIPHNFDLADQTVITIPVDYERAIEISGPAGGVFSTLDDMTRYLMMYMDGGVTTDGTRLISEDNLQTLWTPQIDVSADIQYGLGWFISERQGVPIISHAGNAVGYTSEFAFLPDANLGVVMLSNLRGANQAHTLIFQRLMELVYEQPDETTAQLEFIVEQAAAQEEQFREQIQPIDVTAFTDVIGIYEQDDLGRIELLINEDDQPQIRIGVFTMNLHRFDAPTARPGSYVITTPPLSSLVFFFDDDGNLVIEDVATEYVFVPVTE